jgi:hypothetical protein
MSTLCTINSTNWCVVGEVGFLASSDVTWHRPASISVSARSQKSRRSIPIHGVKIKPAAPSGDRECNSAILGGLLPLGWFETNGARMDLPLHFAEVRSVCGSKYRCSHAHCCRCVVLHRRESGSCQLEYKAGHLDIAGCLPSRWLCVFF